MSRDHLMTARADLIEGRAQLPGIPDHVAASWRRSLRSGVSPSTVETQYFQQLDVESRLVACARPVIDRLTEQLSDVPVCVALTDNRARILARKDSGRWIGKILDGVYFAQGFGYAEGSVGTNGVGTVLEFGESVHIVGAEHFVDGLQNFACAGAPVHDPFTRRIEGVLDISCLAEHSSPIMHSLVRSAAREIERNLLLDRDQSQQALLDLYSRIDTRTRDAVVAVGPRVVVANAAMQTLLDPADREALHDHVRFLTARQEVADERVPLPSGTRVRLRGTTVTVGDEVAGMIGIVTLVTEPIVAGPSVSCPAWNSAATVVRGALRRRSPVLVLGEAGTGRFTLLRDAFDGPVVRVEASEIETNKPMTTIMGDDELLVLCDVDRLSAAAVHRLVDELNARSGPFAATGLSAVHVSLSSVFHESATLPPLRLRSTELPALATAILRDLAPHARLSADAIRVLARYRWPGNLLELQQVLRSAVAHRPAGEIRAADLPPMCESAPRSLLRPVDEAERDAIVSALRDAGGNRKAAARTLGLARSTLYRKIRHYGITS